MGKLGAGIAAREDEPGGDVAELAGDRLGESRGGGAVARIGAPPHDRPEGRLTAGDMDVGRLRGGEGGLGDVGAPLDDREQPRLDQRPER